jgi:cell division septum initiation protein DivIVA
VNSRDESATPPAEPASQPSFDLVLRGYHKGQVDQHLAAVQDEIRTLYQQRDALKRDLDTAVARTTDLSTQLDQLQRRLESDTTTPPTASDPTIGSDPYSPPGPITDKLVRVAKREAALVRANATREAANILEAARAEAEAYRRDAEQSGRRWTGSGDDQVASHVPAAEARELPLPGQDQRRRE